MAKRNTIQTPSDAILCCPSCGADETAGFTLDTLKCKTCKTQYFSLSGMPCMFTGGELTKQIWQHQIAELQLQGKAAVDALTNQLNRADLTHASKIRIKKLLNGNQKGQEHALQLFFEAGLTPNYNEAVKPYAQGSLTAYYDQIIRDWHWGDLADDDTKITTTPENAAALARVLNYTGSNNWNDKNILTIGAGACRLSWDLHTTLNPKYSIAFDASPFLLLSANKLLKRKKSVAIMGTQEFPQSNHWVSQAWTLTPPADLTPAKNWFPMCGNMWAMPFKETQFDLIVTPWLIDVNGKDIRDTLAVIRKILKPGGVWINTGPLLYAQGMPFDAKYGVDEIKQLIKAGGYTWEGDDFSLGKHLVNPNESRSRTEELWTFKVTKTSQTDDQLAASMIDGKPAWLVLHHLPIPKTDLGNDQSHPAIQQVVGLINGERSLTDIANEIAPLLPKDIPAKASLVSLFGELLASQGSQGSH